MANHLRGPAQGYRYYEIVADTIRDRFQYGYFAIRNMAGHMLAVQPYFLLDQDLLEGLKFERSPLAACQLGHGTSAAMHRPGSLRYGAAEISRLSPTVVSFDPAA